MNKRLLYTFLTLFLSTVVTFAQAEGLTSSPYSLYGLGVINQSGIGRTNAMGYSGIGLKSKTEINTLNSANFALIPQNSFFYDVGLKGGFDTYSNSSDKESKTTLNFSNIAVAFRIAENFGAGITMIPYSDVGYSLVGLQTNIEGTEESFESDVTGLGGLSDLKINLGYGITESLRMGVSGSLLFGNIEEQEAFQINGTSFNSTETTNYAGIRLGLGMQFDFTENITLGSTLQFPTSLKGNLTRTVQKNLGGNDIDVEQEESDATTDFNMPLELGIGISSKFLEKLTISADYKKNYWTETGQVESLGSYVDQDIYAFGFEYLKNSDGYKYRERIRYRAGFNYDNGYLAINDNKIDSYNFTAGIGLPIGSNRSNSMLNLSYGYGSKGRIQNVLIKENYHLLTLNFSLEDLWFKKRKIN